MTQLLQNAVYGTLLILAAAALRGALKDRLLPGARLALWAVCLFRLFTPAAPTSALSFWGLFGREAREVPVSAPAPGTVTAPSTGVVVPVAPNVTAPAAVAPAETGAGVPWGAVLASVWIAVGVILAARYALAYVRTRRAVRSALPLRREGTRYAALPKCARLREGPLDGAPLTFGVARPTVVLTPGLGGAELACVLVHEGVHARRRDNLWHYATAAALTVFWWNPAVWLMARLIRRDVELSCDRAAVRRLGAERRAEYAAALVTLSTQAEGGAFCQGFGPKRTEERIIAIMKYKKTTWAGIALAMVLVLSMTVVFASTPEDVSTPDLGGVLPATLLYEKWQYEDAENMISAVSETDVPAIELWGSCGDKDMMDLMEAQGLDETMPLSSDLIVNSTLRAYETSRGSGSLRFNISSVRPYFKIYIYNSGSETLHVSMTYQSKDNTSLWDYDIAAGKSYTGVWMANQFGNFYLNFTSKPSGNSLQGNVSIRVSSNVSDLT